jgi:hypothetical protein
MSAAVSAAVLRPLRPWTLAILLATAAYLGYLSGFPAGWGFVLSVGAVALAAALRVRAPESAAAYAPVPVLAAISLEAATAPLGFGTEIMAGIAGLAFLLWLADDPARPVRGPVRALPALAVPALALGIAWSSTLFVPLGAIPLGVAGGLLALALGGVAVLVGFPELFDREEERS